MKREHLNSRGVEMKYCASLLVDNLALFLLLLVCLSLVACWNLTLTSNSDVTLYKELLEVSKPCFKKVFT